MIAELWNQTIAVIRMEIRKSFLSKRSIWIYLLAIAPAFLLFVNSFYAARENKRIAQIAKEHPMPKGALGLVRPNMTLAEAVAALGEPYAKDSRMIWTGPPMQDRRGGRAARGGVPPVPTNNRPQQRERLMYRYTDGEADVMLFFIDGRVAFISHRPTQSLANMLIVFATQFQLYFVRLAIFFGCAGVFTNLFRGELLDKSLHFYLLAPVPRPILVLGKFLAGVLATSIIFGTSTALQFAAILRGYDTLEVQNYLQQDGWTHVFTYVGVSVLACLAYGSFFLAAGLVTSNPTVPAAFMLVWESVNAFTPGTLKMMSVLFYLQSLCPIAPTVDTKMPPFLKALITAAEPTGVITSVAALVGIAVVALSIGSYFASKLEINYSAD
jgi:ABC-type transport system involved in multi-copper enzyme maturation permease subunit